MTMRRAEPGSRRRAQEVRVDERVPEDALVGSSGRGEHGADEEAERDPRRPELPEDGVVGVRERRLDAEERDVAQHLRATGTTPEVDRPEREPEQRRQDDEDAGGEGPAEGDPPKRPLGPGREACPEAADARHSGLPSFERGGNRRDEVDRPRAPAGRDVVIGLDDARRSRPRRSDSNRASSPRSQPSARSTSCRRGR